MIVYKYFQYDFGRNRITKQRTKVSNFEWRLFAPSPFGGLYRMDGHQSKLLKVVNLEELNENMFKFYVGDII